MTHSSRLAHIPLPSGGTCAEKGTLQNREWQCLAGVISSLHSQGSQGLPLSCQPRHLMPRTGRACGTSLSPAPPCTRLGVCSAPSCSKRGWSWGSRVLQESRAPGLLPLCHHSPRTRGQQLLPAQDGAPSGGQPLNCTALALGGLGRAHSSAGAQAHQTPPPPRGLKPGACERARDARL